jgi:poly-D-alanine transfer protein DltD
LQPQNAESISELEKALAETKMAALEAERDELAARCAYVEQHGSEREMQLLAKLQQTEVSVSSLEAEHADLQRLVQQMKDGANEVLYIILSFTDMNAHRKLKQPLRCDVSCS